MEKTKVKIIREGNRRLIPLPDDAPLAVDEVYLSQVGSSVLVSTEEKTWDSFFASLNEFSDDFMADGRQQPTEQQKRDFFFDE